MRHDTFDPGCMALSPRSASTRRTSRPSASSASTAKSPLSTSPASAPCSPSPAWARRCFPSPPRPTEPDFVEFSIKKCGCVTQLAPRHGGGPADHHPRAVRQRLPGRYRLRGQGPALHRGRHRPRAAALGHQLLPPLPRPLRQHRHRLRLPLARRIWSIIQEILDEWCKEDGINVHLTIDREQPGWDGHVGFVPNYVKELGFDTEQDRRHVRPAHHDQVHAGRTDGAWLRPARRSTRRWSCSMKCGARQMRPLQHRQQIRLQGRPGVPLRSARRAARRVLRRKEQWNKW